jgi:hypothetical protein
MSIIPDTARAGNTAGIHDSKHSGEVPVFLPSRGVKARYGNCTDMTIWRWQNDPAMNFPKPYYFGRLKMWRVDELDAFEASRRREPAGPVCVRKTEVADASAL